MGESGGAGGRLVQWSGEESSRNTAHVLRVITGSSGEELKLLEQMRMLCLV